MPKWTFWVATALGIGRVPVASGTVASGATMVLIVPLSFLPSIFYVQVFIVVFAIGWYSSALVEKTTGQKDSSLIVIDEVAGMLIACFQIPSGWTFWMMSFLLFRAFDIYKPFPARWIDRNLSGGAGIMLDDVVAGIYANLVVQALSRYVI